MPETAPPANPVRARWQLLLLMLLPILVVLAATFVFYTRIGLPEGTRNKGVLILPPQQINTLALKDEAGQPARLEGESEKLWTFLMPHAANCDETCRHDAWVLRQTHTALGKYQGHVRRVWLVTEGRMDEETRQWLSETLPGFSVLYVDNSAWLELLRHSPEGKSSEERARFYLVDPRGFVMMYYRWEDDYKDVITDMKFLLKGVE